MGQGCGSDGSSKFLWKRKHFEEAGSEKYSTASTFLVLSSIIF